MLQTRISTPADIPRQRELWQLAFGDDGAYVDNFYHTYYKPERMLMLEEDGVVQAMTAWFDTTFAVLLPGSTGRPICTPWPPTRRPGAGDWPGGCSPMRTAFSAPGAFRR